MKFRYVFLSVCLAVGLSVCLPASVPVCLSVCFFVFLCHSGLVPLCISASLSLNIFLPLWFVYFLDLFFFLWFFHPCLFPSFSMLFRVLVLFLQTVSASLLTLRCFFNFFNQIFGLLLFHVLLFSVVCCFYIDTVTMEVSRHHPSNHTPHRVWSNRSRSLKKLQTSFSKAAYSTLKWKKKKRFETLILVDVVLIVSYCLYFTHSFPVHPFYTPWKHQKTVSCSNVFRG